jgi:hypothetical protein
MHIRAYYRSTPPHVAAVEHGDQGRVANPSLAGQVKISVGQSNFLHMILVVRYCCRAGMHIDFFEEVLICLEVASPSMESQDAHEHILVIGKICHCLDILNMGVLTQPVCVRK